MHSLLKIINSINKFRLFCFNIHSVCVSMSPFYWIRWFCACFFLLLHSLSLFSWTFFLFTAFCDVAGGVSGAWLFNYVQSIWESNKTNDDSICDVRYKWWRRETVEHGAPVGKYIKSIPCPLRSTKYNAQWQIKILKVEKGRKTKWQANETLPLFEHFVSISS